MLIDTAGNSELEGPAVSAGISIVGFDNHRFVAKENVIFLDPPADEDGVDEVVDTVARLSRPSSDHR